MKKWINITPQNHCMNQLLNVLLKERTFGKLKVQPAIVLWLLLGIRAVLLELIYRGDQLNNFLIYKYVFFHTIHQQNLYALYPAQYGDSNHYGPLFSVLILPFAVLPTLIGCFLWCLFNMLFLLFAIEQLPIKKEYKMILLLVSAIEMQLAIHETQFNPIVAGLIILSFVFMERGKVFWAAFFIMVGFLVKLYPIAGICFICFSKDRLKFVYFLVFWLVLLVCLPMIISSPHFIMQSYRDWWEAISLKNAANIDILDADFWQDISVMGMIRRIFRITNLSNWVVILPASLFYMIVFFRQRQYPYLSFRLAYLAFLLIGVVIFSSSAESPTYIIASMGVGIWFVLQPNKMAWHVLLPLILCFLVSNLFINYLFPKIVTEQYFYRYSIKVVPYFLVWVLLAVQLVGKDYSKLEVGG